MIPTKLYAFYGSLRRGLHNHQACKPFLKYKFSTWLAGYQLYSLGDFPFAFRTDLQDDKILIEIFEIESADTRQQIDELERGFAYHTETILTDGRPTIIYLFGQKANYPKVAGGDWAKFFRG